VHGGGDATGEGRRVIEVFADVACPFTHVGLRRFVEHRRTAGHEDVVLRVRAWPLEIVNGHRLDPQMVAEEVEALRPAVASDLFIGFDPARFPATSRPAFALAAAAYRRDLSTGEAVSLALRDALFEQGEDVADPGVLAAIARPFDLEVDEVDAASVELDHAEGVARGVIGSPHFFPPDGSFFCPSLRIDRDERGALRVRTDAGLDEFLAVCFG
jgi:predicted DsbA family dithiol-disulfide isomerase